MPVAMMSTSTSPRFGPSRSTSTISSGFLASNATAARVFMLSVSSVSCERLCLQKAPDPTADACIVVRRVERGDRRIRLRYDVVPLLDQRLGERRREFGMKLEGDRRTVRPCQPSKGCELRPGNHVGVRRRLDDLVLMRGGNGDLGSIIHPWLAVHHRITVQSRSPALGRLDHSPTKRLGHHLMPEAHADHLRILRLTDE